MNIVVRATISALEGAIASGVLLFAAAGTMCYWQAWVFLVVVGVSGLISSVYLLRRSPAVLRRRMPATETRRLQKVVAGGVFVLWGAMLIVSALDHRFGWSAAPVVTSLAGNVLVAAGMSLIGLVLVQNSHAAVTVRVESGQQVVSDGLYGLVRHPMYACNVLLLVGTPLALGSYWGLVFLIPGVAILGLRIRDEEELLQQELDGYRDYMQKVRYRLVPGVW
ncbi:methyltransferase family protein [Mycobacterium sp. NPDC003449]